jgi:hypothetical protein
MMMEEIKKKRYPLYELAYLGEDINKISYY